MGRHLRTPGMALLTLGCAWVVTACAEDWLPIAPDELKLAAEPAAPGASAIYLYSQVDRNDNDPSERNYERIKILTEDGRKYADIEIPYLKGTESVGDIRARTIRPDGTILNFDGKVFDKTIVKARGVKYFAKTFAIPDVQVGSIIEYRYRHDLASGYVFNSHWILSQELYTRKAKFTLRAYGQYALTWSWPLGLPEGTKAPEEHNGTIELETANVPAFVEEDDMPPANELKYRVDFIYSDESPGKDVNAFWKRFGKQSYRRVNDFIDERRTLGQAVTQIVAAGDPPLVKLQKLYARSQQIRNVSYEHDKTEQETKREDLRAVRTSADVWNRGYGDGLQVTWLFLGLARAAGFQADPVLVSARDQYFFNARVMNSAQLNTNVVRVKLDDKDLFLDPGAAYTPFGMLPWSETAVKGLRLDKDGGDWLAMPLPAAGDSRVERHASLQLSADGELQGKLTVTYSGLEAAWRRANERDDDDTERRQFLEDQVKYAVPIGSNVKLTNTPDWSSSAPTLVAEYDLRVPGFAESAGRRLLMSVGLFGNAEKHMFERAARVHPLYFEFPYQHDDDIAIELPAGWQVSSTPSKQAKEGDVLAFSSAVDQSGSTLHLRRSLTVNIMLVQVKYYDAVRGFFQTLRASDEQQIVLTQDKEAEKH